MLTLCEEACNHVRVLKREGEGARNFLKKAISVRRSNSLAEGSSYALTSLGVRSHGPLSLIIGGAKGGDCV